MLQPEHRSEPTSREQLLSMPPQQRITHLAAFFRRKVAQALGVEEGKISLTAPFGNLNEEWQNPYSAHGFLAGPVEEALERPLRLWEFLRWPYATGPIDTIQELSEHLARELDIPAPQAPYTDLYEGGTWAWSLPARRRRETRKRSPVIFLLGAGRSGSTLLRVMLARHPGLYSGSELHLLPFAGMAERHRSISELGYPWMEWGLHQTLAALEGWTPEEAAQRTQQMERDDVPIPDVYGLLQERIGNRTLVDKSPPYTMRPAWLARAEELFEGAKYLFLARHPYAMIESSVRMRFHHLLGNHFGVWDENAWLFAEKLWAVNNHNAIEFLKGIDPRRQHAVLFEDLLSDPEAAMRGVCDSLNIPFTDAVLHPYEGMSPTWELGDPDLQTHSSIDPSLATAWKKKRPPQQLSAFTQRVAAELGYSVD